MGEGHTVAIFLAELIVLLFVGRMLGDLLARIGQPAIFGQLLAGVALGPSLFGLVLPDLHALIFPDSEQLKTMIDAISEVGILLLLLLTGMETNLQLVTRKLHVVMMTSISGIAIPFVCGLGLGLLLPADLVPDAERQLITALFLGTALSISSVKIVAMVLMEVGFIRRDLGQLILATAILDDTIAWILVAVISGMAAQGTVDLGQIGISVVGVIIFLVFSLTIGRRIVAWLIQWSNDTLLIEFPVITTVLIVTLLMALVTDLIGVHSALGAFIAGVVIAQSPILKGHIEQELRGLIIAFFSPIFFAVAGLGMDLTTLAEPYMLLLALAFITVASIGKSLGALLGGRLAGLTTRESFALATGLNARGSTEVIIATIGLSLGVLNTELYTLIVAMAVITTMIMPPTLRWALARVPLRADERKRLEDEEAAEQDQLPKMERVLVSLDNGRNAAFTAKIVGAFAAGAQILTTVLDRAPEETEMAKTPPSGAARAKDIAAGARERLEARARKRLEADAQNREPEDDKAEGAAPKFAGKDLIRPKSVESDGSVVAEAAKGYNIVFFGRNKPLKDDGRHFQDDINDLLTTTDLPIGVGFAGVDAGKITDLPRHILVPTNGTENAMLASEIAVALARSFGSRLTVLNVVEPFQEGPILRRLSAVPTGSVLDLVSQYAKRQGIKAEPREIANPHPDRVIQRIVGRGSFDLVVLGAELRQDGGKFLGPRTSELIKTIRAPLLLIVK